MLADSLNRLAISLPAIFSARVTKKPADRGPLPTWVNDPQLSKQLLKDTGLTAEDLGSGQTYDDTKPFFMQQNYW